jgi:hypothetical protein
MVEQHIETAECLFDLATVPGFERRSSSSGSVRTPRRARLRRVPARFSVLAESAISKRTSAVAAPTPWDAPVTNTDFRPLDIEPVIISYLSERTRYGRPHDGDERANLCEGQTVTQR